MRNNTPFLVPRKLKTQNNLISLGAAIMARKKKNKAKANVPASGKTSKKKQNLAKYRKTSKTMILMQEPVRVKNIYI